MDLTQTRQAEIVTVRSVESTCHSYSRALHVIYGIPRTHPLVDTDWQFELVIHEINRLKEILHSQSLPAEDRAIAQSQLDNYLVTIPRK